MKLFNNKLDFRVVAEKERELGRAQSEIRALRATEALKDKALEEVIFLSDSSVRPHISENN